MCACKWIVCMCKQTHIFRVKTINKQSIINKQWILATTRSCGERDRKKCTLTFLILHARILHARLPSSSSALSPSTMASPSSPSAGISVVPSLYAMCVCVCCKALIFACTHNTQSLHSSYFPQTKMNITVQMGGYYIYVILNEH